MLAYAAVPVEASAERLGALLSGKSLHTSGWWEAFFSFFSWGAPTRRVVSPEEASISREVAREYLVTLLAHGYNVQLPAEHDSSAAGHKCMYVCMYVCMYMNMHVCVCVCVCVYIYAYMYIYIYVCVCM
jgi:hypothetical protein